MVEPGAFDATGSVPAAYTVASAAETDRLLAVVAADSKLFELVAELPLVEPDSTFAHLPVQAVALGIDIPVAEPDMFVVELVAVQNIPSYGMSLSELSEGYSVYDMWKLRKLFQLDALQNRIRRQPVHKFAVALVVASVVLLVLVVGYKLLLPSGQELLPDNRDSSHNMLVGIRLEPKQPYIEQ